MSCIAYISNFATGEEETFGLGSFDTMAEASGKAYVTLCNMITSGREDLKDFLITPVMDYGCGEDNYYIAAMYRGNVYYKCTIISIAEDEL